MSALQRRGRRDKEIAALVRAAVEAGARCKETKSGAALMFPNGVMVVTHWGRSDWRAVRNLRAAIRRNMREGTVGQ